MSLPTCIQVLLVGGWSLVVSHLGYVRALSFFRSIRNGLIPLILESKSQGYEPLSPMDGPIGPNNSTVPVTLSSSLYPFRQFSDCVLLRSLQWLQCSTRFSHLRVATLLLLLLPFQISQPVQLALRCHFISQISPLHPPSPTPPRVPAPFLANYNL